MKRGRLEILLIDDDENDTFFFQRASEKDKRGHAVHAVHDAADAIRYLRGEGQFGDREQYPVPNVIFCDLKMVGMSGFEFLQWVRSQVQCSAIPVIIFSSSALESDIRKSYQLGASSFISKPASVHDLADLLRIIYDYWSRCECPPLPAKC